MIRKRKSILSNLEKNYNNTNSISKTVDISSFENDVDPHKLYNNIFKKIDKKPENNSSNNFHEGDMVFINDDTKNQYEIININSKNNIIIKNINNNDIIQTTEENIKPIMENIDMAKKEINETQYSVSINGLETTDANALSQMMSAAALADSGSADVGGLDMTSAPELPTPENTIETLPQDDMNSLDSNTNLMTDTNTTVIPTDTLDTDEPSFEDSDLEGIDDNLPSEVENPLDNPESEMDSFEDDFNMDSEMDIDEPVVDDIEFDEEITPSEDETEIDDMEITESQLNESRPDKEEFDSINENVLQELYDVICEQMGDDYLSDYDEVDYMELLDCVKDFGNDIEGFDEEFAEEYADALQEKWKEEHIDDGSDYEDYGRPNWEDDESDEEINEDILLPKETEDETYNASKKLEDDEEDEDAERISESMDALIKSILENADAKSAQEIYAEEISESDESNNMDNMVCLYDGSGSIEIEAPKDLVIEVGKSGDNSAAVNNLKNAVQDKISQYSDDELKSVLKDYAIDDYESMDREEMENYVLWILAWNYVDSDHDDLDSDIEECLKNAGVQLDESKVKPTIVTDESSFTNKPNKALKDNKEKVIKTKTVDTSTFGKDASEGFKEPLHCIKCEAVSPKEKIKAIYETAKVRYSKASKDEWNALDRRYIRKLIENGCGYTRASKIILEAKKKK